MTEWEFFTEVVERADCGILLDVNNIYVSSINHEFDPAEYVDFVPAERVAQMHIAGHSRYETTSWTRTIIPSSILSGSSTSVLWRAPALPPPCLSGTTASRPSRKFTTKP